MRKKNKVIALLTVAALSISSLAGGTLGIKHVDAATKNIPKVTLKKTAKSDKKSSSSSAKSNVNEDGSVNDPSKVKVDKNKLVMWSLFSGGDGDFMNAIIDNYNGASPSKQVQPIMLVWADYYTKLETAVSANKGPDLGVSHVSSLPQLVEDGVVEPITDYLKDMDIDLSEHYSQKSIDAVTFDGEIYAVPLDTHAEIMYFNKDILQKAGVTVDADGKPTINSVDDFYSIMDKIKPVIPNGGSTLSLSNAGDDPYRVWWASYFQMGGTPILNEKGDKVTLDKDIAIKAADFVKGLYDKGYIAEGIDDQQKLFQSGKAGIEIGGTWATGAYEQTDNLKFSATPFPQLFDNKSCWADSHTLILPVKKSRSEKDTKSAVEFMVKASMEGGLKWAESGQIPACKDVLSDPKYKALPYRSGYMEELDQAVLPTKVSTFNAIKQGMIDSLDSLWAGKSDSKAAINSMYDELSSNLP